MLSPAGLEMDFSTDSAAATRPMEKWKLSDPAAPLPFSAAVSFGFDLIEVAIAAQGSVCRGKRTRLFRH